MEKKKNIVYITGYDRYGIESETRRFIDAFRERQDSRNIDIYRIEEIKDWKRLLQDIQTVGLFVEKRLFVFSGSLKKEISKKNDTKSDEPTKTEKKNSEAESLLLSICENISDETFIIFSGVEMDEKSPLRSWLENQSDMRRYDNIWDESVWKSRYPKIADKTLGQVLLKIRKSLSTDDTRIGKISYDISQSLEKISLMSDSRDITDSDIDESIFLETPAKMFDFSDCILRGDVSRSIKIFHFLLETMSVHGFLANYIGILRPSIYVIALKGLGKSQREITTLTGIHSFLVQKSYESRMNPTKLFNLYHKLLSINIAYRSGKGRKDSELGRIFDIELAIIGLKK